MNREGEETYIFLLVIFLLYKNFVEFIYYILRLIYVFNKIVV